MIGRNPPSTVMEGFLRRFWRSYGIDKVAMVKPGIFVVRFTTMEKRDLVLVRNCVSFYNKLVVVKPWNHLVDIHNDVIKTAPTCVQLKLDFKY